MNRSDFLAKTWQPYPVVQKSDHHFFALGRVALLHGTTLTLENGAGQQQWELSDQQDHKAPWGVSCPVSCLRPGDIVAVHKTNCCVFLLSPCLHPQQPLDRDRVRAWGDFLFHTHEFFRHRGFQWVDTPFLVTSPGVDHHIDFMSVTASGSGRRWTLPTSPEIHLKKAMCQGLDKIYEIKRCFRDDLKGPFHRAEFTMLEWYEPFVDLAGVGETLGHLLRYHWPDIPEVESLSLPEVFQQSTGFSLTPETTSGELQTLCDKLSIATHPSDDWNDLFFRIYMEKIEPGLGQQAPVLLKNFPPQQASLAQLSTEGWAQRFELYWKGVELANAFLEVNDPDENRARFGQEAQLREAKGSPQAPRDDSFLEAMETGFPPSAGIAVGMDRLFALGSGRDAL